MVLKQCSIKYSLLFYFTGFLGKADYACGVPEPSTCADAPSPYLPWHGDAHGGAQHVPESSQPCTAGTTALGMWLNWDPHSPFLVGVCVCTAWERDPWGGAGVSYPPKRHHGARRLLVQRCLLGVWGVSNPQKWGWRDLGENEGWQCRAPQQ